MTYRAIIIKDTFRNISKNIDNYIGKLSDDGSIFVIYHNEYDRNGDIKHDVLELTDTLIKKGLYYVNIVVYPSSTETQAKLKDNVKYIVWLCINPKKMYFNKDVIREKSIWKNVEWGKREKNYNPLGKDPTNVWIPTIDNGKAMITEHVVMDDALVIERILKMTDSKNRSLIINNEIENDYKFKFNYIEKTKSNRCNNVVYFGTSEKMKSVMNGSCDLVITSPPYWDLKDYFKEGQIGQESYDVYLKRITKVFGQCYKKLSNNGTFCLNINVRTKKGHVFLIPYEFVNICKSIGFHYKGIIIWHKSSGIPMSKANLSDHFEYILIFSKTYKLFINREYKHFNDYKNPKLENSLFWNLNRKAGSVGKKYIHPAIYPNELTSRAIDLFTAKFGHVLDPFLGSGTTLISSINQDRSCIGYEYNEGFEELIKNRISKDCSIVKKVKYVHVNKN